jgi:hypothetical protein
VRWDCVCVRDSLAVHTWKLKPVDDDEADILLVHNGDCLRMYVLEENCEAAGNNCCRWAYTFA